MEFSNKEETDKESVTVLRKLWNDFFRALSKGTIKHRQHLIVIVLAVIFFVGTSGFNHFTQKGGFIKWLSPDETANYFFTKSYSEDKIAEIYEKRNSIASDIIHPRSVKSEGGYLRPVSFPGIILIFGAIAKISSYKIIPFLTPFFGAIALIFFYLLIKEIFGPKNAFFSTFVLFSFPPLVYYSARSMFHNVLFLSLLVTGLYFGVMMAKNAEKERKKEIFFSGLSGFFISLAIITRASEALWLIPILLFLWTFNMKKIGAIKLMIFLSFFSLALLPMFYWNQIFNGDFINGGYPEMNESIRNISEAGARIAQTTVWGDYEQFAESFLKIKNNIFHFGFSPRKSGLVFSAYFIKMFFWIWWPAVLGMLLFLQKYKKLKKKHWLYFFSYLFISLVLVLYYGSWEFYDNPDRSRATIGNSYTRYWLPVYLGAIPFASIFIIKVTKLFKNTGAIIAARIIIIVLFIFISGRFVLAGSEEGLIASAQRLRESENELREIMKLTENSSIIITKYHDKLLFPERAVIFGLFDDKNMIASYAKLAKISPLYYYNFTLPEKDFDYLNEKRLGEVGLRISVVERITNDFTLYKLELKKDEEK